jgi:hypothetical protein
MDYVLRKFETPALTAKTTNPVKSHLNYSLKDTVLDVNDISEAEINFDGAHNPPSTRGVPYSHLCTRM